MNVKAVLCLRRYPGSATGMQAYPEEISVGLKHCIFYSRPVTLRERSRVNIRSCGRAQLSKALVNRGPRSQRKIQSGATNQNSGQLRVPDLIPDQARSSPLMPVVDRVPIYLRLSEASLHSVPSTAASNQKETNHWTPLEHAIDAAYADNYTGVCLPITNEKWKDRWNSLCLTSPGADASASQAQAEKAEAWRVADGFRRDEVNLTKLGMCDSGPRLHSAERAY